MRPVTSFINNKEIVRRFAEAVQEKDFELIASLLADEGEFNTLDAELNTLNNCNKPAFMQWVTTALSDTTISKIEYDQCLHCMIGNPVVIFNDGKFPTFKKDISGRSMTGLMLDIDENMIKEIKFCYVFLEHENKFQYECIQPKIDLLLSSGIELRTAIKIVMNQEGYIKD